MSDILEDLCSADPEETPSAAKLTMTRAAAEIESLRKRLLEAEALVADQHDQTSPPDRPRDGRSRGHRIQGMSVKRVDATSIGLYGPVYGYDGGSANLNRLSGKLLAVAPIPDGQVSALVAADLQCRSARPIF
jgi:hypothetical protein